MSTKISQLTSAVDVTANDLIQIVDVEDGVMAPSGTNKKATASLLANQLVPLINAGTISGSKIEDSGITSAKIANGTIVDADINASAAISGTKISPNFGSQNIVTAGTLDVNATNLGGTFLKRTNTTNEGGNLAFARALDNTTGFTIDCYGGTSSPLLRFVNNANAIATITTSGNLGIGIPNPNYKLHVYNGDAAIINTAENAVVYVGEGTGANQYGYLEWNRTNNTLNVKTQNDPIVFGSQSTDWMRLTTSGNLGIGTETPGVKLSVTGLSEATNGSGTEGIFQITTGTGANVNNKLQFGVVDGVNGYAWIQSTQPGTTNRNLILNPVSAGAANIGIGTTNPSYQLQLSLDSAAKPSTSTWTVSSDERLKENIEAADLDICYNAVKSIPLKRYKWKDEIYSAEQVADRNKIGWIAQDVQAVFPKAVGQHKFVYNQVKDEEGNIVSEDSIDDCLSLNSDQLYAALFGAVQKLMGEVESLQDRIAELESAP